MLIETKNAKYRILEDLGILVNDELTQEFSHLKSKPPSKSASLNILKQEFTDSQIMDSISQCGSIALVTTESCNFRCKYCVYSGKYPNERVHSDKKMSIRTGKKAVDLLFNLAATKSRQKKKRDLVITFYGGESLLEFSLLKQTIEYAENESINRDLNSTFDVRFRVNTNGYLLNQEVIDFFKLKSVYLDISLDGPERQHDRFRVKSDGKGTWKIIISNLKNLKQKYPDYYHKRVNYIATMHPLHDGGEIDRFFSQTPELFQDKVPRLNLVSSRNLIQEEKALFEKNRFNLCQLYTDRIYQELEPKFKIRKKAKGLGLTGTCFPGAEKILVNCDGSLSICEKISQHAPKLGHVDDGFDLDSIKNMLREYCNSIIDLKCWDCPVWFLCDICLANAFDGNQFRIDCSIKETYFRIIKNYIEEKEEKDNQKYSPHTDNILEFIEQL